MNSKSKKKISGHSIIQDALQERYTGKKMKGEDGKESYLNNSVIHQLCYAGSIVVTKKENLLTIRAGHPKDCEEVFDERFPETSTCLDARGDRIFERKSASKIFDRHFLELRNDIGVGISVLGLLREHCRPQ
jgi:hypothetical protein